MQNKNYLGIDTSNYKTSVAIVDETGALIFEKSKLLAVDKGDKGLRQSLAFFKHSNILPDFFKEAFEKVDPASIKGIAYSSRPRRVEGSYMPVFLAGENIAKSLSYALGVPIMQFSHQEGHIKSALSSSDCPDIDKFLCFHLSGGTSEFLLCEKICDGYKTEIVGGSLDISIGQLLDRVGVKAGFQFPAGSYLDDLAFKELCSEDGSARIFEDKNSDNKKNENKKSYNKKFKSKVKLNDGYFNLSGIETAYLRRLDKGDSIDDIAGELFLEIEALLLKASAELSDKYDIKDVLWVGGVASSNTIRERIKGIEEDEEFNGNNGLEAPHIIFGDKGLSGDNAVGIARLGLDFFVNNRTNETK